MTCYDFLPSQGHTASTEPCVISLADANDGSDRAEWRSKIVVMPKPGWISYGSSAMRPTLHGGPTRVVILRRHAFRAWRFHFTLQREFWKS